jgi:hypothetical protein
MMGAVSATARWQIGFLLGIDEQRLHRQQRG